MVEYSIACLGSLCEDSESMNEIVNAGGLQILIQIMLDCVNSASITTTTTGSGGTNTSTSPTSSAGGSSDHSTAITPAERLMAVLANTISRMSLTPQVAAGK